MSHFVTLVILPKGAADLESALNELLAPYDEGVSVPEYTRPCFCIGSRAKQAVCEAATAKFGDWNARREKFGAGLPPGADVDYRKLSEGERAKYVAELDRAWAEFIKPMADFEQAQFESHPDKDRPNPECDECHGSGAAQTRYNPKSKWDWWQIGGRWTGSYDPGYDPAKDPRNIERCDLCGGTGRRDDEVGREVRAEDPTYTCNGCNGEGRRPKWPTQWARYEGDVLPVARILELDVERRTPFALVTPDGVWHERGEMGLFGIVCQEQDQTKWQTGVTSILQAHMDHIAVVCDMHI